MAREREKDRERGFVKRCMYVTVESMNVIIIIREREERESDDKSKQKRAKFHEIGGLYR